MGFSHSAAMSVVPTLARLVLAAAFIPAGASKLFTDQTFEGQQAQRLIDLGVSSPTPAPAGSVVQAAPVTPPGADSKPEPAAEPALVDTSKIAPARESAAAAADSPSAAAAAQPGTLPVVARKLHGITLMVEQAGWNFTNPTIPAWGAALTEFVGGILILVGLLSRVWGLGLACVMGVALYLTSWAIVVSTNVFWNAWTDQTVGQFNMVFCQLGLFVLAFGILLTGPGPLSLDRMLLGPRRMPPHRPIVPPAAPVVVRQMPPTGGV